MDAWVILWKVGAHRAELDHALWESIFNMLILFFSLIQTRHIELYKIWAGGDIQKIEWKAPEGAGLKENQWLFGGWGIDH